MKKIKPFSRAWVRRANAIAYDFAPIIYPCNDCGGPVATGFCCTNCGTRNPDKPGKSFITLGAGGKHAISDGKLMGRAGENDVS